MNHTALHDQHRALGAKMTDFHGWDMPLYYTSILEEHQAVREALGIFDVSHMGQVIVSGPGALRTLNHLMTSDISQVGDGRACYTLMLNEAGGIVDDLLLYRIGETAYLVIVNCANRASDVEWMRAHAQPETTITDISEGRCIVSVQGPLASRLLEHLLDAKVAGLGRMSIAPIRTMGPAASIARTGYTGGDGFELFLQAQHARAVWRMVLEAGRSLGARAAGLGARDTLRIEAGLRLYGSDMDTQTTPFDVGLDWTVAMGASDFLGRAALVEQRTRGIARRFIGIEFPHGPVPRPGTELMGRRDASPDEWRSIGMVTSGTFSPLLHRPLGMGRVDSAFAQPGTSLSMVVRHQRHTGAVVKLPFWKPAPKPPTTRPSQAALTQER